MSFDIEKIKEMTTWIPDKRSIEWAKQFIQGKLKTRESFIWASSFFSIKFSVNLNDALITDINFPIHEAGEATFENLARTIKILEKLNYNVECDKEAIVNLASETRIINERIIDKNQYIPRTSDRN
jgi:hypothetical protein